MPQKGYGVTGMESLSKGYGEYEHGQVKIGRPIQRLEVQKRLLAVGSGVKIDVTLFHIDRVSDRKIRVKRRFDRLLSFDYRF